MSDKQNPNPNPNPNPNLDPNWTPVNLDELPRTNDGAKIYSEGDNYDRIYRDICDFCPPDTPWQVQSLVDQLPYLADKRLNTQRNAIYAVVSRAVSDFPPPPPCAGKIVHHTRGWYKVVYEHYVEVLGVTKGDRRLRTRRSGRDRRRHG